MTYKYKISGNTISIVNVDGDSVGIEFSVNKSDTETIDDIFNKIKTAEDRALDLIRSNKYKIGIIEYNESFDNLTNDEIREKLKDNFVLKDNINTVSSTDDLTYVSQYILNCIENGTLTYENEEVV